MLISVNVFCQPKPTEKYVKYAKDVFYKNIYPKMKEDSSLYKHYKRPLCIEVFPDYMLSPSAMYFKKGDSLLKLLVYTHNFSLKITFPGDTSHMYYINIQNRPCLIWDDSKTDYSYLIDKAGWEYFPWKPIWFEPRDQMNPGNVFTVIAVNDFYLENGIIKTFELDHDPVYAITLRQYEFSSRGVYMIRSAGLYSALDYKLISRQRFDSLEDDYWLEYGSEKNKMNQIK